MLGFDLTCTMNCPLDRGASPSWEKEAPQGPWHVLEKVFKCINCACARSWRTCYGYGYPFPEGSVFKDGTVRIIWDGDDIEGMNSTQLLVRLMLGSKDRLSTL